MSSFKEKLARVASKTSVVASKVSEYTKVVNALGPTPRLYNVVGAAVQLLELGTKDLAESAYNIKTVEYLNFISTKTIISLIDFLLSKGNITGVMPKEKHYIVDVYGMTLLVSQENKTIHIPKGQCPFKSKAALARLLWDNAAGALHIHIEEGMYYASVGPMKSFPTAQSEYSDSLEQHVRTYLNAGKNRTIFLHGVPGTGKTTVANTVCKNLFQRILFIDMKSITPNLVISAVEDLDPEAVILNEIDKGGSMEYQLESLEHMARRVKLMIATSNIINDVPAAVLRPGRFSEIVHIDKMDRTTLNRVIRFDCTDEVRDEIQSWPIAFIVELNDRMEVGVGSFDQHFQEIKERVQRLRDAEDKKNKPPL